MGTHRFLQQGQRQVEVPLHGDEGSQPGAAPGGASFVARAVEEGQGLLHGVAGSRQVTLLEGDDTSESEHVAQPGNVAGAPVGAGRLVEKRDCPGLVVMHQRQHTRPAESQRHVLEACAGGSAERRVEPSPTLGEVAPSAPEVSQATGEPDGDGRMGADEPGQGLTEIVVHVCQTDEPFLLLRTVACGFESVDDPSNPSRVQRPGAFPLPRRVQLVPGESAQGFEEPVVTDSVRDVHFHEGAPNERRKHSGDWDILRLTSGGHRFRGL